MLSTVAAIYAWDEVVGLGGVSQQGTGAELYIQGLKYRVLRHKCVVGICECVVGFCEIAACSRICRIQSL